MHGEDPSGLVEKEEKVSGINKAVFLGDYDTPDILRNLRNLKIKKKFIIGNHDLHYVYGLGIIGSTMKYSWEEYASLWNRNPKEKDFIEKAIIKTRRNSGLILEDKLESGEKIVYCHGGIVDSGSPDSDAPGYVWQRMYSKENALMNFLRMREKDYWTIFRGHDHSSFVIDFKEKLKKIEKCFKNKITLAKNNLHIVNVGAFFNGDYALFDEDARILKFKNTGYGYRLRGI